jgi:phosphatidylglycerophosphate synthase
MFLTWLLMRLGVRAMTVTALGFTAALLMPFAAYFTSIAVAGWGVCLLGMSFQILDCSDGDIARLSGSESAFGARADFLADMAQWGFLYTSIGILADRQLETGWAFTCLGLLAAWIRLFARLTSDSLPTDTHVEKNSLGIKGSVIAFFAGLSGLIPFLALIYSYLGYAVFVLLIYSLLDIGDALQRVLRAGGERS